MSQITYNIELGSKPDRLGRTSVMIRLHLKGHKPGRVLTSVKILQVEKHWNPKPDWRKWVVKHPDRERLNNEIVNEHDRVKAQVESWQKSEADTLFTPALLADRFRNGTSEYFFDWIDKVLDDAKEQAFTTHKDKKSAANLFKSFAGPDVLLQSVSPVMARQFQEYLKKKPTHAGSKRKGSGINKVVLRLDILHQAILVKTGFSPKRARLLSPWTDVSSVEEIKPQKAKFNQATVKAAGSIDIVSKRRSMTHDHALRIWLLCHALAGARFADVLKLRYCEFETDHAGKPIHLRYEMMKTGNGVSVPLFDEAKELLSHYWKTDAKPTDFVLPFLKNTESFARLLTYEQYRNAPFALKRDYYHRLSHWNTKTNQCLKEIEVVAGLTKPLRVHSSRHSFADLARTVMEKDGTLTMYDIQKMMGHSALKTTEIYTNSLQERDTTQPMQAIFNRSST